MRSYKTVLDENHDEYIVKKSRFIGYAKPVKTRDEAVEFINRIKQKHWDATHNVYAYVIREGNIRRYSDDGEPQGTAGVPTLDVLLKEGLSDVVVVGTRYFGGIMLGAGGLVRAYSHTAKIAVESAKIITMAECFQGKITCDYNFYGKLNTILCEAGATVTQSDFADDVTVLFFIGTDDFEKLGAKIFDSSNGRFKPEKASDESLWVNITA